MDGEHFDAIVRALTRLRSRRGLTPILLGLALGTAGGQQTAAKNKKHHKKKKSCPPCKKRKQGKCKGKKPDGTGCTITGGWGRDVPGWELRRHPTRLTAAGITAVEVHPSVCDRADLSA